MLKAYGGGTGKIRSRRCGGSGIANPYSNSQVAVLLHGDGTNGGTVFTDESNKVWSQFGAITTSTAQSKFGGSSILFNGTSQYLCHPQHTDFAFGSGDFTVALWVRGVDIATRAQYLVDLRGFNASNGIVLTSNGAGALALSYDASQTVAGAVSNDTWYHLAIVRSGTNLKLYLDGTSIISVTYSTNIAVIRGAVLGQIYAALEVPTTPTAGVYYSGYMDDILFLKGFALYTANFTPPTTAYGNPTAGAFDTYYSNVKALLHFEGSNGSTTFTDQIPARAWTAAGNAQISTAQFKYGSSAGLGDGTGDFITCPDSTDWNTTVGQNWTWEGWVYRTTNTDGFYGFLEKSPSGGGFSPWLLALNIVGGNASFWAFSSATGAAWAAAVSASVANDCPLNTWTHLAFVYYYQGDAPSNCRTQTYVNGVPSAGTTQVAYAPVDNTGVARIMARDGGVGLPAYFDDFRFTPSVARYIGKFTPPTVTFPDL